MALVVRSVAIVVSIMLPVDAGLTKMTLLNKVAVAATAAEIPPDQAAARTLLTLDVNQDGRVDASEVAAFAKTQGYEAAPTTQEFMGLDANHDGSLDVNELSSALSLEVPVSAPVTPSVAIPAQQKSIPVEVQPVQMTALSELAPVRAIVPSVASVAQPSQVVETPATQSSLLGQTMPQVVETPAQSVFLGQTMPQEATAAPDAQQAAALIAHELSIQATKENDARSLDRKAAELRANSTALTRQTIQRVLEAGSKAASTKTTQLLQTLTKIENEAEEAEVQAAALRAKSKAELEQASDFMSIANAALGTPNQGA